MLTSFLRRIFSRRFPVQAPISLWFPEWSDAMAEQHAAIWWKVQPFTTACAENMVALCQYVAYLEKHRIAGAIVECGVGKGGGAMTAALSLLALDSTQREIYLYDAFEGNSLQGVKQALMQTRYPWEKFRFVPYGAQMVVPERIALLHLRADSYEANYQQLELLYLFRAERMVLMADTPEAKNAAANYLRAHGIKGELRSIATAVAA